MVLVRFEDLDVWKRSARLDANIYKELSDPKDFGFRDQITRSGLSIPSNIAEGMERRSITDKKRYYLGVLRGIAYPDLYRHRYWLYRKC